jgi:DNA-binding Lrp family transcriptional regulator
MASEHVNVAQRAVLDEIDVRILRHLQRNGRMTNVELAEAVHLTPAPCLRRVRSLEERGVIRGYVAVLDPTQVGLPMQIFVNVTLQHQTADTGAAFEAAVVAMPEVLECHVMAGESDYLLKVAAAGLSEYHKFLVTRLGVVPGIAQIRSMIPLQLVKSDSLIPI